MRLQTRQSGFTLVEIAIVLVIIGLLLGGVLKGQELIESSKIKSVINDMKGASAAFYAYQDRYRALPGDDAGATNRFAGGVTVVNGGGNGAITGAYQSVAAPAAANETNNFWQHTRLAGFLAGDLATNNGGTPSIVATNGFLGIQDVTVAFALNGVKFCVGSTPSKYAQAVDIQLDDGDARTGNVRTGAAGAANAATAVAVPAANYTAGAVTTHTMCQKI